jgi:hypothetical protein
VYEVVHLEHECTNHLSIWTDGFAYLKGEMMRSGEEGANWPEDGDGVRVAESAGSGNNKTLFLEEYGLPEKLHTGPQERCWRRMYRTYLKNVGMAPFPYVRKFSNDFVVSATLPKERSSV